MNAAAVKDMHQIKGFIDQSTRGYNILGSRYTRTCVATCCFAQALKRVCRAHLEQAQMGGGLWGVGSSSRA